MGSNNFYFDGFISLGEVPSFGFDNFRPKQSFAVKDYKEAVKKLIQDKSVKGLVAIGAPAVRSLFPNANNRVHDGSRFNLCIMPFDDGNGNYKPVLCLNPHTTEPRRAEYKNDKEYKMAVRMTLNENKGLVHFGAVKVQKPLIQPVRKEFKYTPVKDVKAFSECLNKLRTSKVVTFDFETHGLTPHNTDDVRTMLYSVAFTFDDWTSYAIPLEYWRKEWDKIYGVLKRWVTEDRFSSQLKIAHNLPFDLRWFLALLADGEKLNDNWGDTQFLAYLLDERASTTSLKFCSWRYLGRKEDWSKKVDVTNLKRANMEDVLKYNAEDTHITMELYHTLNKPEVLTSGMKHAYDNVLMPSAINYAKITDRGIDVDLDFLLTKKKELETILAKCKQEMINSSKGQVFQTTGTGLLDFLRMNSTKEVNLNEFGTDADGLKQLAAKYANVKHPTAQRVVSTVNAVLNMRKYEKILSTYVDGTIKYIMPDKKIHSETNLTFTVSGRTSAQKPNLQNVPKRSEEMSEVRKWVVAPPGHTIVAADMGQIEARIFAVVSGDKNFVKSLFEKYDIHMDYSLWLFNNDKDLAKKKRGIVKACVFAAFYGCGPGKIAQLIGITEERAKLFIEKLFFDFPAVPPWQDNVIKHIHDRGYLESLFGRQRRGPVTRNQALNFIPQSTASDMTLVAMNEVAKRYKVMFTIHDDITMCIPDDKVDDAVVDIAATMIATPWEYIIKPKVKAYVPLSVGVATGKNWADMNDVYQADGLDFGLKTIDDCLNFNKTLEASA